jgi:TRAP-type C4-dicarboxylate transport system substrate-binding protein
MKKNLFCWMLGLILGIALTFTGTNAFAKKTIELTYSIFFPSTHIQCKLAQAWADEIAKRTSGRVKITLYPAGSLTPPNQAYQGVVQGISDIAMTVCAYEWGRFPLFSILDLPVGYPDPYCPTRIANELYAKYKPKELDDVHICYIFGHGPGNLHTKKPVLKFEDWQGLKIRHGATSEAMLKAFGAVLVSMPQNDVYEALRKGIVDGTIVPNEALKGWKQAEVIKSTTKLDFIGYTAIFLVEMNKKRWNSLPKDIQKVITEVSHEWLDKTSKAWEDSDRAGIEYSKSLGNEVHEFSAADQKKMEDLIRPINERYVEEREKKGVPAKAFYHDLLEGVKKCRNK